MVGVFREISMVGVFRELVNAVNEQREQLQSSAQVGVL